MNASQRLQQLRSLREQIAALGVVKCRMSHERVVLAGDPGLPIRAHSSADSYRRIGLCPPEHRARQLGCSHTAARIWLGDAIQAIALHAAEHTAERLGEELRTLDNAIHLLDHRKGEAEKTLAHALSQAHMLGRDAASLATLRQTEDELRDMEQQHDAYVEGIAVLRERVLGELDALMQSEQAD